MPHGRKPIFCYVTDRRALEGAPESSEFPRNVSSHGARNLRDCIHRAIAAGTNWIQIREKGLDARTLAELTRFAVAETRGTSTRILVNDRLDVALAANAAGIHLGEKSVPLEGVTEWRQLTGQSDFLIGVSCHSLETVQIAERGGADYVFFGPVFATPSKAAYGAPQGLERLREVCAAVEIPVLAIGGVNMANARDCIAAGAAGIAAIRLFQDAENSDELAAGLKTI